MGSQTEKTSTVRERKSGIELLRIVSMLFIVIFHVTQTLTSSSPLYSSLPQAQLAMQDGSLAPQNLLLLLFQSFGNLGNVLFFICSAWFLCDSTSAKLNKIVKIVLDTWLISVLVLSAFLLCGVKLGLSTILACFLPTTTAQNWYLTCYLLIYFFHPYLNKLLHSCTQAEQLKLTLALLTLYSLSTLLFPDLFFSSAIVSYTVIYIFVAYLKQYRRSAFESRKTTNRFLLFGSLGFYGLVLLTVAANWASGSALASPLRWYQAANPFLLLMALGIFNVFRRIPYQSSFVNRLAGLSLLVYLLHENVLFRTYVRPRIFVHLYQAGEYRQIILWILVISAGLLLASWLLGSLYSAVFSRPMQYMTAKLTILLKNIYRSASQWLLSDRKTGTG